MPFESRLRNGQGFSFICVVASFKRMKNKIKKIKRVWEQAGSQWGTYAGILK